MPGRSARLCMMGRVKQTLERCEAADVDTQLLAIHVRLPLPTPPRCLACDNGRVAVGIGAVVAVYECVTVRDERLVQSFIDLHLLFLVEFAFDILHVGIVGNSVMGAADNALNIIMVDRSHNGVTEGSVEPHSRQLQSTCSHGEFWMAKKTQQNTALTFLSSTICDSDSNARMRKTEDMDTSWHHVNVDQCGPSVTSVTDLPADKQPFTDTTHVALYNSSNGKHTSYFDLTILTLTSINSFVNTMLVSCVNVAARCVETGLLSCQLVDAVMSVEVVRVEGRYGRQTGAGVGVFCLVCTTREVLLYCVGPNSHLLHQYISTAPPRQVYTTSAVDIVYITLYWCDSSVRMLQAVMDGDLVYVATDTGIEVFLTRCRHHVCAPGDDSMHTDDQVYLIGVLPFMDLHWLISAPCHLIVITEDCHTKYVTYNC